MKASYFIIVFMILSCSAFCLTSCFILQQDGDGNGNQNLRPFTNQIGMTFMPVCVGQKWIYVSQTPVTQGQWALVDRIHPIDPEARGEFTNQTFVTWSTALSGIDQVFPQKAMYMVHAWESEDFCRQLGKIDGNNYRLMTTSEWMAIHKQNLAHGVNYSEVGWMPEDRWGVLQDAGTKRSDPSGLKDFYGSVLEWCCVEGDEKEPSHLAMGRSYLGSPPDDYDDVSANRTWVANYTPNWRYSLIGFRVVMDIKP